MFNNIISRLKKNWRDFASFFVVFLFLIIFIITKYNLGMLICFIILFVSLSFDRIKRIIFDLNVKKIFGIEFGELEKIKENLREEVEKHGIELSDDEINVITEAAFNQIIGIANKPRYYEELIYYALKDLNVDFMQHLSGGVGKDRFEVDFLIELDETKVLGIESIYSDSFYLGSKKIDKLINTMNVFKKADNLSHFLIITNTQVREEDKERLKLQNPPIDVIENIITPSGILSRLQEYLFNIDKSRKGSLEQKT